MGGTWPLGHDETTPPLALITHAPQTEGGHQHINKQFPRAYREPDIVQRPKWQPWIRQGRAILREWLFNTEWQITVISWLPQIDCLEGSAPGVGHQSLVFLNMSPNDH